ncbi:MAG: MerR family transcriptional regulator [Thermodesulfobacteriota bacterium]
MKPFYIGEVSRVLGKSCETLRNLERRGIFTAQRDYAGRRVYTEEDIQELQTKFFPQKDRMGTSE